MPSVLFPGLPPRALRILLLAGALLLQGGEPARAERDETTSVEDALAGEMVPLRFGWPVGLEGRATSTSKRTRTGQPDSPFDPTLRYDFVVKSAPRGLRVLARNGVMEGLPSEIPGPQGHFMLALQKATAKLLPDLIVAKDGSFVDIADAERIAKDVRALLSDLLTSMDSEPQVRQRVEGIIQQLASADSLRLSAANDWNSLVGAWTGADLELGALYQAESVESIPLLGGASILNRTQFAVVERIPCNAKDQETRCVRIESRTRPDPDNLKEAIGKFVERMLALAEAQGRKDQPVISGMEMLTAIDLVTEPGSLVPHLFEMRRSTRVETRMPDGTVNSMEQFDVRTFAYEYKDR